jgi:hypothetical protein
VTDPGKQAQQPHELDREELIAKLWMIPATRLPLSAWHPFYPMLMVAHESPKLKSSMESRPVFRGGQGNAENRERSTNNCNLGLNAGKRPTVYLATSRDPQDLFAQIKPAPPSRVSVTKHHNPNIELPVFEFGCFEFRLITQLDIVGPCWLVRKFLICGY